MFSGFLGSNQLLIQKTLVAFSSKLGPILCTRYFTKPASEKTIQLFGQDYETDEWTNIPQGIKDKLDRNLLHTKYHPLCHLTGKIKHFFYKNYINRSGTPIFSIYDSFKPVVTVEQNFDR